MPFRSAIVMLLADHETFNLLEHRRVRQVEIVAPVHLAGHDDPHRGLVALHVADLHRRGVGAQQRRGPAEAGHLAVEVQTCPAYRAQDARPAY